MSNPKITHQSLASLKLPRRVPALITYAQGIVTSMTNNPHFPAPVPALTAVSGAISDLQVAETAALARTKGAVATRNAKRTTLVSLLKQLLAYVQGIADGSPENGPSIIESAGLAVKKTPTHVARVFEAKQGASPGLVKLLAPSAAHRSSYLWQYSIDGGKNWVDLMPTLQARTSVTLSPGSSAQFRYRSVTKTGATDWSTPVTLPLVK